MPRRASTYHDTEKANSGELDNSGGSTGKNRPLPLKPTLPRVLSRANASVVDEE